MLQIYASNVFKEDIRYLIPIFIQLKEPEVPRPADPLEIEIKEDIGKGIMVISKFEEMVFQENVKQ